MCCEKITFFYGNSFFVNNLNDPLIFPALEARKYFIFHRFLAPSVEYGLLPLNYRDVHRRGTVACYFSRPPGGLTRFHRHSEACAILLKEPGLNSCYGAHFRDWRLYIGGRAHRHLTQDTPTPDVA